MQDYSACKWPDNFPGAHQLGSDATSEWFDDANESPLQQPGWALMQQLLAAGSSGSSSGSNASSATGQLLGGASVLAAGSSDGRSDSLHVVRSGSDGSSDGTGSSDGSTNGSSGSNGGSSGSNGCNGGCRHPDIISFSHFLPHQSLLPEKRMLTYPNLVRQQMLHSLAIAQL